MVKTMEIEITARDTIKPSSPTPPHLRNFSLSFFDQMARKVHIPFVLFYPFQQNSPNASQRSQLLKTSLSQTLARFYPLAGKLRNGDFIECNDDGADYIEARTDCQLFDLLQEPDPEKLPQFGPPPMELAATDSLLLVQVTFFKCGGMAIGVCITHKIADANTLSTFIMSWAAATALGDSIDGVAIPEFTTASLFPPKEIRMPPHPKFSPVNSITRRFVFDASKIAALKAKAASAKVKEPSRLEAVTALLWKCAMMASRSVRPCSKPRLSVLVHSVNLRKRTQPPLKENVFGNLLGFLVAESGDGELDLQKLVCEIRKRIEGLTENGVKKNDLEDETYRMRLYLEDMAKKDETDMYYYTSWCRFPLYKADFGWGKPLWMCAACSVPRDTVFLLDTRDGNGIEVWLAFDKEEMALFERYEELLEFASLNPSVVY